MTDATDHALEQAERIVQYAKYSDRFMVVEGDSSAERRAFVKLIGQKLPRQVRPVLLRADAGNGASAMIEQLSTLLQLSAGIETIEQLITAATATLGSQDRLLIVVENADHWMDSDRSNALFELINQAHDLARERVLFLLVGTTGLCERVEDAQALSSLLADLHCAQLLGAASPSSHSSATEGAAASTKRAETPPSALESHLDANQGPATTAGRSTLASPTLLIAIIVSIAVVSVGAFALLSRSEPPETESTTANADRVDTEEADVERTAAPEEPEATEAAPSPEQTAMAESATQEITQPESETGEPDIGDIDHGQPPLVPFPVDESQGPADEPTADTEISEKTSPAETSERATAEPAAAEPMAEDARGTTAATPPATVDNGWFREQPRARAAIQMAAFGKLDDATKMIERFANDDRPRETWRIYTQKIDGKILYTVTLGNYPSTERAQHAIESLPTNLKALKPYPRSVGTIQDRLATATP